MALDSAKPGSLFLESYTDLIGYEIVKDRDGNIIFGENGEVEYVFKEEVTAGNFSFNPEARIRYAKEFAQAYDIYAREGDVSLGFLNPSGGDVGGTIIENALLSTLQVFSGNTSNATILGTALSNYWATMYVDLTDDQPGQIWNGDTVNTAVSLRQQFISAVLASYTTEFYFPPFENLIRNVESVVNQIVWTYTQTAQNGQITSYVETLS